MMTEDFSWLRAAIIFVVYVLFDILYALYIICVSRERALAASTISALMYSIGAYGVISYLGNLLYLLPLAAGAFLGTYIAVKYMNK